MLMTHFQVILIRSPCVVPFPLMFPYNSMSFQDCQIKYRHLKQITKLAPFGEKLNHVLT